MEQLKYIIEDSTIAELLGVQNFTNKEAAILELVKNAFDAKAKNLDIIFKDDQLFVKDNGCGMNANDIRKNWMYVGKSEKGYEITDDENKKRVLAGSRGIGKFALSRLGAYVEVYSQKNNQFDNSILWATDWINSNLQENAVSYDYGTKIIIKKLRDKWNKKNIDELSNYLSRTYNDDLMKINVYFNDEKNLIQKYFLKLQLGINCTSIINMKYSSQNTTKLLRYVKRKRRKRINGI